jgi:hypothetical protein
MGSQTGRILYSDDGITFKQASTAGLSGGDLGYRPLVCFKDPGGKTLLITSPVGAREETFNDKASKNPIVLATDDPLHGTWRPYSPLRFDDPDNFAIFSIGALDTDHDGYGDTALYAGISNYVSGAQVWKTTDCAPFPCVPTWTKIADKGAGRPLTDDGLVQNGIISHIAEHKGAIFATFSRGAGTQTTAELVRINPDDSFEIVIGQPRLNIDTHPIPGLRCTPSTIDGDGTDNDCPPLSGRGPGFGERDGSYKDGTAYYFWNMLSYRYDPVLFPQGDDRLYIGTLEGDQAGGTPGFDLLATGDDGKTWVRITTDGLGDKDQEGGRVIIASPIGMFVAGANAHSGTTTNPGGCDVWLGTCDPSLATPPVSDPRVILKSTMPGQVIFDGQRYIAYDDDNYPNPGNGKVTVTLESRSYDPFCGEIVDQKWDQIDLTGSCGSLPGKLGKSGNVGPLTLCASAANVGDCPDFIPSASTPNYNDYAFTLQVTDNDGNVVCNQVTVRASRKLPPGIIIGTNPPAVFSKGVWKVNVVDFDEDGAEQITLTGMCTDPVGSPLICTWSADPGVTFANATLPLADADKDSLGTIYTATVPVLAEGGKTIVLTAVDNLGNKTAVPVDVTVYSTTSGNILCQGVSHTLAKNTVLTVNPATDAIGPRCIDIERQPLSYVVTQPSPGTGSTTGGSNVTYTPPQGFIGTAFFTLQACDPGGKCSDAVGIKVSVQNASRVPSGTPEAPAIAYATVLTGGTIRVTWTDVGSQTHYQVQGCRRALFGGCLFSSIASNVGADTTFIDKKVWSPGTYGFRVRACNDVGCSAYVHASDVTVP